MSLAEYFLGEMKKANMKMTPYAESKNIPTETLSRILKHPNDIPGKVVLRNLANNEKVGKTLKELEDLAYGRNPVSQQDENKLQYGKCYDLIARSKELGENEPLTPFKIADALCSQDKERYNPAEKYAGTPDQWKKIFSTYQDTSLMFYFEREENGKKRIKIAGDFSFVFYPAGEVQPDENGAIAEDNIQISNLPPITLLDGKFDMIILNMSLANAYNESKYIQDMLRCVENHIQKISNDIKIENIYINIYERDYTFYSALGFEPAWPGKVVQETSSDQGNIPVTYKKANPFYGRNDKFVFQERKENAK